MHLTSRNNKNNWTCCDLLTEPEKIHLPYVEVTNDILNYFFDSTLLKWAKLSQMKSNKFAGKDFFHPLPVCWIFFRQKSSNINWTCWHTINRMYQWDMKNKVKPSNVFVIPTDPFVCFPPFGLRKHQNSSYVALGWLNVVALLLI